MLTVLRKIVPWLAVTLAIAAAAHLASLYAIPRLVMAHVLAPMGTTNTMNFIRRPDASFRMVVRPSTDLLYAQCPYDLSQGPLQVTSPVPAGTWWSVAAYDADTNNFYVRDDRQLYGRLQLVIRPPGDASGGNAHTIISPTTTGVVILRTLIDSDAHVPALDALRHRSQCAILH
jgi:uncharacterized membrane protein